MPKRTATAQRTVWRGPEIDGITFSLLSRFLCCRERFRLLVVEGLKPVGGFAHRVEYGNLWHAAEEALAGGTDWEWAVKQYSMSLVRRYPSATEQIAHWTSVCRVQFPLYRDYWSGHSDVINRTPVMQEQVFKVPYQVGNRTVFLKGKWDSTDLVGSGRGVHLDLQENKTKGDGREERLKRQLTFDLQTMIYVVALEEARKPNSDFWRLNQSLPVEFGTAPFGGVRYNVVRRPLSGGKGSITRHKARGKTPEEPRQHFYGRLRSIIEAAPQDFFWRWKVEVQPEDIRRFRDQCLDPILHQLCDWWDWVVFVTGRGGSVWDNDVSFGARPDLDNGGAHSSAIHWRHPFGVYNVMDEGGSSELDEYLGSGSELGLERTDELFPELT